MSLISELFSDIFAGEDNFLTRLDPRTKLLVGLFTLLCLLFTRNPWFPLLVLCLTVSAGVAIKIPTRLLLLRLTAPLGIALMLLILQSLLTGSRVLASVSVLLLLGMVTPAHRLFHASRWMGMPKDWVEIALLMYRYIFVLLDLVADMMVAQRVRLGYSGVRRAWKSAGIVGGTVIVRSIDQAVHAHEAMRVRGYHGEMPFAALPVLPRREWITMGVAGTLLLLVFRFMQVRLG
jgi:cobalt/nickel transport system permease protein